MPFRPLDKQPYRAGLRDLEGRHVNSCQPCALRTYLEYISFFTNSSRVRALCDVATDSGAFVERSVEAMAQATKGCELAIQTSNPNKMVEHASKLGRLANRVIHVARQETENSEDPAYIARLNVAVERVHRGKNTAV